MRGAVAGQLSVIQVAVVIAGDGTHASNYCCHVVDCCNGSSARRFLCHDVRLANMCFNCLPGKHLAGRFLGCYLRD